MLAELLVSAACLITRSFFLPTVYCNTNNKFGTKVPWRKSLKDAMDYGKLDVRPIMVVIWMEGCPSCEELMPKVAASDEIANLVSNEFSAVPLNEFKDEVSKFRVDGGYTPRIYFLSPKGEVDLRFFNKWEDGEADYRFYYPNVKSIVKTMKEVVEAYPDRCMPTRSCKIHGTKDHPMK